MKKLLISAILSGLLTGVSMAQDKIQYNVISNKAAIPKLRVSIYPIDVRMMQGLNAGFGGQVSMRPMKRIHFTADVFSMLYFNPYRFNYDGNNSNALKKWGGINANAMGEFVWRRKGIKMVYGDGRKGEKFLLSKQVETNGFVTTQETKYLPFQFNTLVERTLRAGIVYDDFPTLDNTLRTFSFAFGLGKMRSTGATLGFAIGAFSQNRSFGYSFDVLVGFPTYEDEAAGGGGPIGLRLLLKAHQQFTKKKDLRGYSLDYQVEFAVKPGGVGYISVRLGLPVVQSGTVPTEGIEYKEVKAPTKRLARFLRFI